ILTGFHFAPRVVQSRTPKGQVHIRELQMKKLFLTSLVLAAGMAFAQTPDSTAVSSNNNADKVQGCLAGTPDNFSLTDSAGKSWKLAGAQSDLQKNVGHMVEVKGSADAANA